MREMVEKWQLDINDLGFYPEFILGELATPYKTVWRK